MPDLQFTDAELDTLADLVADRVQARLGAGRRGCGHRMPPTTWRARSRGSASSR